MSSEILGLLPFLMGIIVWATVMAIIVAQDVEAYRNLSPLTLIALAVFSFVLIMGAVIILGYHKSLQVF